MKYVMIYDPKGEPFEVQEEQASLLILNKGWSRTPPVAAPAPALDEPKDKPSFKK